MFIKKAAEIVSFVFHPIALILALVLLGILKSDLSQKELTIYTLSALFLNGLLPIYVYFELNRRKIVTDDILTNPEALKNRPFILAWGMLLFLLEALAVWCFDKTPPLFYILLALAALTLIIFLVSLYKKISLHMGYGTLFPLIIVLVFGLSFWPVLLIAPMIAWSRYVLFRHTFRQLLAGFLAACLVGFLAYILIS